MKTIFEHAKEPLFGRAGERMYIKPFPAEILRQIMQDFAPEYLPQDLLTLYILTGGVPKYVELFAEKGKLSHDAMLDEVFRENSMFLDEGKHLLIEEFGKEYTVYFSILSLIASSKTSRSEIESVIQKDIGGYLNRLEHEYQVIQRVLPVFSKPGTRNIKYYIPDNFLAFWFRFIYKHTATVEIGNFAYLKALAGRDWPSFSGPFLERYVHAQLAASGRFSLIGRYWEKGNLNEIDVVAVNELEQTALIGEVKLNPAAISGSQLRAKAAGLLRHLPGYAVEYRGFSLEDLR
jgi:hypothetical protein